MRSRDGGQASIEYLALLGLVGLLFGAMLSVGVDRGATSRLARSVCWMPVVQRCLDGPELATAGTGARLAVAAASASGLPRPRRHRGAPGDDADGDGLPETLERSLGTDPARADGDGDGRSDLEELESGANPLAADARGDFARVALARGPGEDAPRAAEVARWLGGLPATERRRLAVRYPDVVGALDGAPASMRYEANRLLMRRAEVLLAARVRRLDSRVSRERATVHRTPVGRIAQWGSIRDASRRRAVLERRRRLVRSLAADPARRFIVFDPDGDGRLAEVIGDMERAPNVAVMVPGTGSDIDNFDPHLAGRARELRRAAATGAKADVATVAWLGYDPPDTIPAAALAAPARRGARSLTRFVAGMPVRPGAHVTVVGHSYGSVTVGDAAAGRLRARDVVFTGSPGSGAHRIDVSALRRGSRYWAAHAPGDLVPLAPVHGEAPGDPGFGARIFDATGRERPLHHVVANHQSYYEPGSRSLSNIALIAAGRPREVSSPPGIGRRRARRSRR